MEILKEIIDRNFKQTRDRIFNGFIENSKILTENKNKCPRKKIQNIILHIYYHVIEFGVFATTKKLFNSECLLEQNSQIKKKKPVFILICLQIQIFGMKIKKRKKSG